MGKYDAVPHAMVRIPHGEDQIARNVIIDNDTNTVVWSDEDGNFYIDEGDLKTWREVVDGEGTLPVERGEAEEHVNANFEEPELCLEFLSELGG